MRRLSTHPRAGLVLFSLLLSACADESTAPLAPDGAPSLSSAAQGFSYRTIRVEGAVWTSASGINDAGDVVGSYDDANGMTHGYLLRQGRFTTFDYPGAVMTEARGIGPDGTIVGTYRLKGDTGPKMRSFLRRPDGTFETVAYPGHESTMAQRILPDGTILGCRHDHNFSSTMRGVVIHADGSYSETDAFASMHNGATPDLRLIVGLYTNLAATPVRREGYVIEDGVFKPFMVPGSRLTAAWDINAAGQVVGVYRDAAGPHGFIRTGDQYETLEVPGGKSSVAWGINGNGDVVGDFTTGGGKTYGYVATRVGRPGL